MTVLYNSNFDTEVTNTTPTGWTARGDLRTFTWAERGAAVISGANGIFMSNAEDGGVYTTPSPIGDQAARIAQRIPALTTASFRAIGLALRSNSAKNQHYIIRLESNNTGLRLAIYYYNLGYELVSASSSYAFVPAAGDLVHIEAFATGTTLSARAWIQGTARPDTISGTGTAGEAFATATGTSSARSTGYYGMEFNGASGTWQGADNFVGTDGAGGEDFYYGVDVTAPTVSSAVVSNGTPSVVTVTMSEAMDAAFVPATGAFTVGGHTVSSVGISGSVISLTCSSPFANGEAARTVSYTQPGTNNARDVTGNLLANFSGIAITNNVAAADSTPPAFGSAQVANANPDKIVITMSEALAPSTSPTSAFTASGGKTVTGVAIAGNLITVTVNSPYVAGNTITIAYTQPGANPRLQDATGNLTATFAAQSVTNNIGVAAGVFKSHPIVNNTDDKAVLYKNAAVAKITIYDAVTGDKVIRRTSQMTDSEGVVTVTDAAITPSTNYEYTFKMADGARGHTEKASEA